MLDRLKVMKIGPQLTKLLMKRVTVSNRRWLAANNDMNKLQHTEMPLPDVKAASTYDEL